MAVDQPLRRALLTPERGAILRFGGPHGLREQLLPHLCDGPSLQSLLGEADGLQSLSFHQREAQVVVEEPHHPIGEVPCQGSIHGLALSQRRLPFGQDRAGAMQGQRDPPTSSLPEIGASSGKPSASLRAFSPFRWTLRATLVVKNTMLARLHANPR